jgi:hypothetical protein
MTHPMAHIAREAQRQAELETALARARVSHPVPRAGGGPRLVVAVVAAIAAFLILGAANAAAATLYVRADGSDDSSCAKERACATIGAAVAVASAGDTIYVGPGTFAEQVVVKGLKDLTIRGAGYQATTVSGNHAFRPFELDADGVTISDLTIADGVGDNGGGVYAHGTLTLERVAVTGNAALGSRPDGGFGGGVHAYALTALETRISDNRATADGGGIFARSATVGRSTVSENRATGGDSRGGGLYLVAEGDTEVWSTTVAWNDAAYGGGIASGGSVLLRGATVARNEAVTGSGLDGKFFASGTIVALNGLVSGAANCSAAIGSAYSLEDDAAASCGFSAARGDGVGVNPKLTHRQGDGPAAVTFAVDPDSPARGAAPAAPDDGLGYRGCPALDQRGLDRLAGGRTSCDIGAWDDAGWSPSITISEPRGGDYVTGDVVRAGYSCEPGRSGAKLLTCAGSVPSGELLDTATPGEFVFSVQATDAIGNTSVETVHYRVFQRPAVAIVKPTISGTPRSGQLLQGNRGLWKSLAPITFTYLWLRCAPELMGGCLPIPGATTTSYLLTPADVGSRILFIVFADNGTPVSEWTEQTAPVQPAGPTNVVAPTIDGNARVGGRLKALPGTWTGTPTIAYTYQWQRCDGTGNACAAVPGATAKTYPVRSADRGSTIRVLVTATNPDGATTAASATSTIVR